MVVIYCSNEIGAECLRVALKSLFINNREEEIVVHVITDGFSDATYAELKKIGEHFGREINIRVDDGKMFDGLPYIEFASKVMYYRYLIPEMFPQYDKVLYFDIDIIVQENIRHLWETDVTDYDIAGVIDPGFSRSRYIEEIGMHFDDWYFNSGMMVMNLDRWRRREIVRKCIEWVEAHRDITRYMDQDAINAVCNGHKLKLPMRYNVNYGVVKKWKFGVHVEKEEWEDAIESPAIIHYTQYKPWIPTALPFKRYKVEEFRRYADEFPANDFSRFTWTGTLRFHLKSSALTGWLYRACPRFWAKFVVKTGHR